MEDPRCPDCGESLVLHECGWRRVRLSTELFLQLGAGQVDWGEPDDEGFYTPTIYHRFPCCLEDYDADTGRLDRGGSTPSPSTGGD